MNTRETTVMMVLIAVPVGAAGLQILWTTWLADALPRARRRLRRLIRRA